jgi:two-component system response regulator RegX3
MRTQASRDPERGASGVALRVLVVEDEESIRRGLCDVLAYHGFAPTPAASGEEGLREADACDLVLLDLMLPGIDGFEVCETLRASRPQLPILMLTARGAESDVLRGFRCGADDYVTKPFSISELVARVEALLRRAGRLDAAGAEPFSVGPLEVDPGALTARLSGRTLELTRREVGMLALLARERGRIVSRRALLQEVWGFARADRIETRTVDMHVAKLRRKLGAERELIETVRGEGYRFRG